mgnify:FL=1
MFRNNKNFRMHGEKPYNVITLHGGPGALGELKELSSTLGKEFGVIEYLQTKDSIDSLLLDLKETITKKAQYPVKIVGFSWGAWLGTLFSAEYQDLVERLVLISSGPFKVENGKEKLNKTRLDRMNKKEKELYYEVTDKFKEGKNVNIKTLNSFIKLMHKVDAYEYKNNDKNKTDFNKHLYNKIWEEASQLRKDGSLIKAIERLDCPIKVIHGNYDPHPYKGVIGPIKDLNKDYEFSLLEKCGHTPWREKYAAQTFYQTLFAFLK